MKRETLATGLFIAALLVIALIVGALTADQKWFPGERIVWAKDKALKVMRLLTEQPATITIPGGGPAIVRHDGAEPAPGLTFVVGLGADMIHRAQVIDPDGEVAHEWPVDWFEIWPDDGFLPANRRPRRQPGASIHGSHVLDDASLVFNFEYLSTIKLDACGEVVWKQENLGHHSVHISDDGHVWVGGQRYHPAGTDTGHQAHRAPLKEETAQEISPEGEILREISTLDLFWKNDLYGFLFATTQNNFTPEGKNDTMHLNDVEVFPDHLEEGVFSHGDVMVSLRNINSVVVFDPETLEIKHIATGMFLRQHDPDFTSGNTYTVFDNRNLSADPEPETPRSRILEITASPDGGVAGYREVFRGPESPDYFSPTNGRHQHLDNGNLLAVVSDEGRVIELTPEGAPVWEYRNVMPDGEHRGVITEVQRLPPEMDKAFFAGLQAQCGA